MLIAVSVVSAHIQETHKRWKLEAVAWQDQSQPTTSQSMEQFPVQRLNSVHWPKPGYRLPDGSQDLAPLYDDASQFGGLIFLLDLASGEVVWCRDWGGHLATPSGMCFAGSHLYVADLEGSAIVEVDMQRQPGKLLRRISHPALNDVHYVVRTARGLLVASTGTDMVIELDREGNSLYEWWAGDYGFTATPAGIERRTERHKEHRDQYYHTRYQTTHLNAARYRDSDETRLLILLWRQGQLVEVDTTLPLGQQVPRIVVDGLHHPHSLKPLPRGGWMIADSQGAELVLLDRDLQVTRRIPSIPDWIQDALPLDADLWLVADVNNSRLLIHDVRGRPQAEFPYNKDWRVYGLEAVPEALVGSFTSSLTGAPVSVS